MLKVNLVVPIHECIQNIRLLCLIELLFEPIGGHVQSRRLKSGVRALEASLGSLSNLQYHGFAKFLYFSPISCSTVSRILDDIFFSSPKGTGNSKSPRTMRHRLVEISVGTGRHRVYYRERNRLDTVVPEIVFPLNGDKCGF